jgi:hypothetical protein
MVDRKEDKVLKQLAEETGGRAFFTSQVIELERSFSTIVQELRSQYLIGFAPPKRDGKAHEIEQVGAKLRDMMPWIKKNKLVDTSKN